jgi:hypothetical protein
VRVSCRIEVTSKTIISFLDLDNFRERMKVEENYLWNIFDFDSSAKRLHVAVQR